MSPFEILHTRVSVATATHSFWIMCTVLTFIDPISIRCIDRLSIVFQISSVAFCEWHCCHHCLQQLHCRVGTFRKCIIFLILFFSPKSWWNVSLRSGVVLPQPVTFSPTFDNSSDKTVPIQAGLKFLLKRISLSTFIKAISFFAYLFE